MLLAWEGGCTRGQRAHCHANARLHERGRPLLPSPVLCHNDKPTRLGISGLKLGKRSKPDSQKIAPALGRAPENLGSNPASSTAVPSSFETGMTKGFLRMKEDNLLKALSVTLGTETTAHKMPLHINHTYVTVCACSCVSLGELLTLSVPHLERLIRAPFMGFLEGLSKLRCSECLPRLR